MELYKTQVGSRYYGINIDSSDFDTWIIDDSVSSFQSIMNGKDHIYRIMPGEAIAQFCGFISIPQCLAALFPKNPTGNIGEFLNKNNEKIIEANKAYLYNLVKNFSQTYPIKQSLNTYIIRQHPKKVAYRLMFLNIFINYTKTNNFSDSLVLSEEEKIFFKEIRLSKIDPKKILETNNYLYSELLSNKDFFDYEDINYLKENVQFLEEMMKISHADFIQQSDRILKKVPELKKLY